jgi:SAM-dependent methyltransferase
MNNFDELIIKNYSDLLLDIEGFIKLKGKKVLDFGCGSGLGTVYLAQQGIEVTGIDNNQPGEDDIGIARQYNIEKKSNAVFEYMDGESLTFKDQAFDLVLLVDVMEHLKDPLRVMNEIKRVLRIGGSLVILWQPYYAPFGGHLKFYSKNPWRQLMPFFNSQRYIKKACLKYAINTFEHEMAVFDSLNKLTLAKFRRMLSSPGLGLTVKVFKKRPFKTSETITGLWLERLLRGFLNKLPLLPFVEEFTTQSVLIILERK